MDLNRRKLINLRNNIQAYLNKVEKDDKLLNMDEIIVDSLSGKIEELKNLFDDRLRDVQTPDLGQAYALSDQFTVAIENMNKQIGQLLVKDDGSEKIVEAISNIRFPEVNFPNTVSVDNFPPQRIPQPVTNININGLLGPVKSQAVTVGTTATPLPTEALANRRSIIVWNNDNSTTLWIGGEDVTVANGIPVKKQNYSPALDLSDRVTLYGVVDSGSIETRVLESSMTDIGS